MDTIQFSPLIPVRDAGNFIITKIKLPCQSPDGNLYSQFIFAILLSPSLHQVIFFRKIYHIIISAEIVIQIIREIKDSYIRYYPHTHLF